MPLAVHGVWDHWGVVFDPIPFRCHDGQRVVRCWASLDALQRVSGVADLEALDDRALAELFALWVEELAAIASAKYDAGLRDREGGVRVDAHDVAARPQPSPRGAAIATARPARGIAAGAPLRQPGAS